MAVAHCFFLALFAFSHLFILYRGYLPSACLFGTAGVLWENKPNPEGTEPSHSLCSPSVSPPFCLPPSVPLHPCVQIPSVCLMTPMLISHGAPAVPSAWCQHFLFICQLGCVTQAQRLIKNSTAMKKWKGEKARQWDIGHVTVSTDLSLLFSIFLCKNGSKIPTNHPTTLKGPHHDFL